MEILERILSKPFFVFPLYVYCVSIFIVPNGIFISAFLIQEEQESGCIVNVSSINGLNPAALVAAYNAAKAGIISLTQTLALELAAYGVRVNAICPGPVYTEFNRRIMAQRCQSLNITEEEMIERIRAAIPLGPGASLSISPRLWRSWL